MTDTISIPKNLLDAVKQFSDPKVAWEFFKEMRWPGGVVCPFCESTEISFLSTRESWKCKTCKKQFSVKTRTVMQGSPLPLEKWFMGMWLLTNCKNGISSYEMATSLGISQQSAWFMGHRNRHAMKVGSFEKLKGEVEVDETYVGGRAAEMHADRRREMRAKGFPKICVIGMMQRDGEVRTMVLKDNGAESVQGAIHETVEEGTQLYTDAHKSYNGIDSDYEHKTVNHKQGEYVNGDASTNGIENYWSGLKRTYHGSYIHYSDDHAERYAAEQEFRFNNRDMKEGSRFAAVTMCSSGKRLTYVELTQGHLQNMAPL